MTPAPAHRLRPLPSPLRMLVAALVTCCAALGLTLSPPTTSVAHADERNVTIKSASNGRQLDVQNGARGDGAYIVTNSAPGYAQAWNLTVDSTDFSFSIVNATTGKCIDLSWPALRQQTCQGQTSQKWYFQPVAGSKDVFLIRNQSDNSCLDLMANAQYDDAWTGKSTCHGGVNQRWVVPSAAAAWNLAVDHGAKACQKNVATCTWTLKSEGPAAPLPKVCASSVWYNNSDAPVQQNFTVTQMTGWSSSIGTTLASTFGTGGASPMLANVTSTLSFTNIWQGSTTVGDGITVTVAPKNYGWITLSVLAKKVTGTWTFDARGLPWQAEDTVTVPVKDDPAGGATLYTANTSPTFTSCA
ncbi:RICIN domain-containing protein [Streptomyces cinnamoneus]|uniref:RICIN domain-containing protein n=1 Tax=Streptomyces cinnamoneus TaxID=53446 RepID=UPI003447FEC1